MKRVLAVVLLCAEGLAVDGELGFADPVGVSSWDRVVGRVAGVLGFGNVSVLRLFLEGCSLGIFAGYHSMQHRRIPKRHRPHCHSYP